MALQKINAQLFESLLDSAYSEPLADIRHSGNGTTSTESIIWLGTDRRETLLASCVRFDGFDGSRFLYFAKAWKEWPEEAMHLLGSADFSVYLQTCTVRQEGR